MTTADSLRGIASPGAPDPEKAPGDRVRPGREARRCGVPGPDG